VDYAIFEGISDKVKFLWKTRVILIGLDPEIVELLPRGSFKGYIAPTKHQIYSNFTYLGSDEEIINYVGDYSLYFGFDRPNLRQEISNRYPIHGFPLIASSAILNTKAIGTSTTIANYVFVGPGVKIGNYVKLNARSSIHHDCKIDDFSVVSPSATLCGNVKVGKGVLIGAGATILPGITLGEFATIGAGAVVTRDVEPYSTYVGIPARKIN
jgi:sugar O-acyltransferase (sialic acid O-acetyltransferase NeuD family)